MSQAIIDEIIFVSILILFPCSKQILLQFRDKNKKKVAGAYTDGNR